ncbi:hypothetical protein E4K64_09995 [Bradyrhizobium frederickii]|uniref:Uncharacterized protein n=1 Tax=Bradyrhizobium frederickii TaxID=2560054 RepID=A0A4Y9P9R7_9BRAD|nr:hypothetical protein E4K64_09995 [Bradyrhizobium frederickii]
MAPIVAGESRRRLSNLWCHAPRKRGIQYAAASRGYVAVSGILDRPPSRTMTVCPILSSSEKERAK